jgi:Bacterial alpha-L-rhamnosidase 6 hairpin glycosidase domain
MLKPVSVYKADHTVQNPDNILSGQTTRLNGTGSALILDFGKEVAGTISLNFVASSDSSQMVGMAFAESSLYAGPESDASNGGSGPDGAIYTQVSGAGTYTMPIERLRGGFRYLTIFLGSSGWVDLNGVTLSFTASPATPDMRSYQEYFYSNDELLNQIWYAGAYTLQMDTVDPTQGITWPAVSSGWQNTGLLGGGRSILVDGAKRDRTVWPGDIGISQLTALLTTYDTESAANTLNALYQYQESDGRLPYAGPPILTYGSDTYHLWTLAATGDYFLFTGDKAWLDGHWSQYKLALQYSMQKIDSNRVFSVDQGNDWGRTAKSIGEVIGANALFYGVLSSAVGLARAEGDTDAAAAYDAAAQSLKQSINKLFWDAAAVQYVNAPGSTLYPQDGNALALFYGLVDSPADALRASQALRKNWNSFGAQTPEKPNTIAPFPGSMEVFGHFAVGDDQTALDLIRLEWGYMLNSPIGTGSTFWEGYLADGTLEPTTTDGISWYGPPKLGSYMSLAHGWSTGPTSALTLYVLGVAPEMLGGFTYHMIPHPGDLTHAQGKVMMPNGPIVAFWSREKTAGTFSQVINAPPGAVGRIGVPTFGRSLVINVDKQLVWNNCSGTSNGSVANFGFESSNSDGTYVYLEKLTGNHTIESTNQCSAGSQ